MLGLPKSTEAICCIFGVSNANSEQDTAICTGFWVLLEGCTDIYSVCQTCSQKISFSGTATIKLF